MKASPKAPPTKARPKESKEAPFARPKTSEKSAAPKVPPNTLVEVEVPVELEEEASPAAARPAPAKASSSRIPVELRPARGSLADPSRRVKGGKRGSTSAVNPLEGTVRLVLDYHGVLDCDVAATQRRGILGSTTRALHSSITI